MISQQKKPEHLHSYHTTDPLSAAVFNQAEIKHKNSIHHYELFKINNGKKIEKVRRGYKTCYFILCSYFVACSCTKTTWLDFLMTLLKLLPYQ